MKILKVVFMFFSIIFFSVKICKGQIFYFTSDLFTKAKFVRTKQIANSIENSYREEGNLIINFTARLSRKLKNQKCHIVLPLDTILKSFEDKTYFNFAFDSIFIVKYHIQSIERRFSNISEMQYASGIDILCFNDLIISGFKNKTDSLQSLDKIKIVRKNKNEPFELGVASHSYLRGKHIVFLYAFFEPQFCKTGKADYLVINIENNPKINKWNYLKLPYTLIKDIVFLPWMLLMSGNKK